MKRWLIIGFIALLFIVSLIIFLRSRTVNNIDDVRPAEVVEIIGDWKTIKHFAYEVSIQTPSDFNISVFGEGMGRLESIYMGNEAMVSLNMYRVSNADNLKAEELSRLTGPLLTREIEGGGLRGVSYIGKIIYDDYYEVDANTLEFLGDVSIYAQEDSYVTGKHLLIGEDILSIECSILGREYFNYISVCDEILKSIEKIQ